MPELEWLAGQFEQSRSRLRALAGRLLGSPAEADDAVQEAWLRLSRSDADAIENLRAWLTTVVSRVCLDRLRARVAHPAVALEEAASPGERNPEQQAQLADSVGVALAVVLETLAPPERVAFVLHDLFDLPFAGVAAVLECSPVAARQLASRARRRVRGATTPAAGIERRRALVAAFAAASRDGDLEALLRVLAPGVVLRADAAAVAASRARLAQGAPPLEAEIRGAHAVAETFRGRARGAQAATIGGQPGLVWAPGGQVRAVFRFRFARGAIRAIEITTAPEAIRALAPRLD